MGKEDLKEHEKFMRLALNEAHKAYDENEVPIGAVIVHDGKVIARGHDQIEKLNDVTAHAEMIAITSASTNIGSKFLNDCVLYVTIEPCVMCAGAIFWSRISKVYFGAYDEKQGFTKVCSNILHQKTNYFGGILQKECSDLLISFFQKKR